MSAPYGPVSVDVQVHWVRKHALTRGVAGAWDMVSTMDDRQIKDEIAGCTTCWGAIDRMSKRLKPLAEFRETAK